MLMRLLLKTRLARELPLKVLLLLIIMPILYSYSLVYKGEWRNQEVAIKILKNAPESQELSEFKKELEIMSSLRSPFIVYFFGMVLRPKVFSYLFYSYQ